MFNWNTLVNHSSIFKKNIIDNTTFRLHYQYTSTFLCIASILTTSKQYFGDPIDCNVDITDGVSKSMFKTFCWIQGTFTLPAQLTGKNYLYPGVGPYPGTVTDPNLIKITEGGEEIRHSWYQWVPLVLIVQAILCYFPHFIWKGLEGGKMQSLLQNIDLNSIDTDPKNTAEERTLIVNYIRYGFQIYHLSPPKNCT